MPLFAENIDPYDTDAQYGWSENTGWVNLEPGTGGGVQAVSRSARLLGYAWCENIGWINFSCDNDGSCGTVNFGVYNNSEGNLSGYAWAENVGWINFDPYYPGETRDNPCKVSIDSEGYLDGWAWGENIGWIQFDKTQGWSARVCVVGIDDLQNFAELWLSYNSTGNLDAMGDVDMKDFSIFTEWWLDYCPDGWGLK